ncbi:hypothetical protein OPV22_024444 [Ensete ventricosum]|uniref:LIM zinc-binding domain-containing protein n=1 Tax=Ensete ventricosum TaxID=4639 RepID=A0AAV8P6D9_ENSVE|nr:hypothetical protein OPV22_024444 [Ensete ventricosum]
MPSNNALSKIPDEEPIHVPPSTSMPSISSDVVLLHGPSDLGREANLQNLSESKLEQSGNSYEISRSYSRKAVGSTTDDLAPTKSSSLSVPEEYKRGDMTLERIDPASIPTILLLDCRLPEAKSAAGQSHGSHADDVFWTEPSSSIDVRQGYEDEDVDHAIALSLSEEDQKGKAIDNKSHLEEDEQLARVMQESLFTESPPRRNGQIYQPYPFSFPSFSRRCAGCNKEVGHGRYLSVMGAVWHPECFRCHQCNKPIYDHEFSMYENHPYHKSCYRKLFHPKCDVCKQFIPEIRDGRIEYRAHPFWGQKYCPLHERDGTPRCCSCERMESMDAKYVTLDDGRLNMKVEQQIPLLLVERQALNEAMEGEKNGHRHLPETRGLCLSEEQIVRTILRRPIIGPGNRLIDMITGPYRLIRRCEVTAILILYGLPRLLIGSILAHEMMHAWLRLKGYRNLDPDVEEGICQVLAHMWLDSEIISGSGSNVASSSSARPSKKEYGDGFRAANGAVDQYGLRRTLDHISLTGRFP